MRLQRLHQFAILFSAAILTGTGIGCGGETRSVATVRGRVLFQGQPLVGGTVVFAPHPDRGPAGKSATALIGPDGEYRLTVEGSPYLAPGWYRVAIADSSDDLATHFRTDFPRALRRPDRSGVEREVLAGKDNVFDLEIVVGP